MSKIDWNKVGKWSLILAPIVIGGYLIYNQLHPTRVLNKPQPTPKPTKPDTKTETSYFPLKKGSNNDYVGQLQDELGIAIDNQFGKDTLAALKEQTGKTQINDYNDLIATLTLIDNNDVKQQKSDDAKLIIDSYNNAPLGFSIVPSKDIRVTQLSNLAPYIYTNTYENWGSGLTYFVIPKDITSKGDLVVVDTNDNSYWAVDSRNINQ